jgi:minimal PKS acyl carrier protein
MTGCDARGMTTTSATTPPEGVAPQMFTLDDLRQIMRVSVGVDDGVDIDGDISDVNFDDLGYDSLAVLELAGHVRREYGVPLPDEMMQEIQTPASAVALINDRLTPVEG